MTADQLRRAADVLELAAKSYGAAYPQHWQWTADQLRNEAQHFEVCFAAALVCTPIIGLTGGPWYAGFLYGGYFFFAFGVVGTLFWAATRVCRR